MVHAQRLELSTAQRRVGLLVHGRVGLLADRVQSIQRAITMGLAG